MHVITTVLPAGHRAGPYIVEHLLGSGAFADVYLARHHLLDQPVALKIVRAAAPERREQEGARLMCRLDHTGIVRVHFADCIDGHFAIAMEYVAGETLRDLLARSGRLAPERAAGIAAAVCDALEYLHSFRLADVTGYAHLDVTPSNVLIDVNGLPKLADFGLASVAAARGNKGAVAGSPAYMAPEQFVGRGSPRSDLWAVGALMFEMLSGDPPVRGSSLEDYQTAALQAPPTSWPETIPPPFRAVIARCLQPEPTSRPASACAIAEALRGCAGGRTAANCSRCGSPIEQGASECGDCTRFEPVAATKASRTGMPAVWKTVRRPREIRRRTIVAVAIALLAGTVAAFSLRTAPEVAPRPLRAEDVREVRAREAAAAWQQVEAMERSTDGTYEDRIAAFDAFRIGYPESPQASQALERRARWEAEAKAFAAAQQYEQVPGRKISEALRRWQAFETSQQTGFRLADARQQIAAWQEALDNYEGFADLTVLGALGLPQGDMSLYGHDAPDAYFILRQDGRPIYRSRTVDDTSAPVWRELTRPRLQPGARFTLAIFDRDWLSDDVLVEIPLGPFPPDGRFRAAGGGIQLDLAIQRER